MGRYIGVLHRVKKTAKGEARPTLVAIDEGGTVSVLELPDEVAELDFVYGQFPISWRVATEGEDVSGLPEHHRQSRKKRGTEEQELFVPETYEGLKQGDTVAMVLGGSGDRLAFALSRHTETLGEKTGIFRIPPFALKQERGDDDTSQDHRLLASLIQQKAELFYPVGPRDRAFIFMREAFRARTDAMKDRMACAQRLRQRLVGAIFLSEEGGFPEGAITDRFDAQKANDQILTALMKEEEDRNRELKRAVRSLDVWERLFEPIEGCGETIAAGIMTAVGDVMRFYVAPDYTGARWPEVRRFGEQKAAQKGAAKLKKYLGVHVLEDGRFPRKRVGQVANWSPEGRQSLYLLADQFNRRPESEWGKKFRAYKVKLREAHPEVEQQEGNGKKRYTKAHIHKMAMWRTLTKFVEWLYREWTRIEREVGGSPQRLAAD